VKEVKPEIISVPVAVAPFWAFLEKRRNFGR
jgi:hypothetical protein